MGFERSLARAALSGQAASNPAAGAAVQARLQARRLRYSDADGLCSAGALACSRGSAIRNEERLGVTPVAAQAARFFLIH
jgi:hypothetical protein